MTKRNHDISVHISDDQMMAINDAGIAVDRKTIDKLLSTDKGVWAFSPDDLTLILRIANAAYRAGVPIITDSKYDSLYLSELKNQDPDSDYLKNVEPEPIIESKTVELPVKMLSTEKAYSKDEVEKWIARLRKSSDEIDLDSKMLTIRVTPKLDGYAAYDDGLKLYTRGDGARGQDISRAFARGLKVANDGDRGQGPGEVVISKSYFDTNLSPHYENARNIQAAIIAEKKVDERIQQAIHDEACVFFPFRQLGGWVGHYSELLSRFSSVIDKIWHSVDYEVDGVILEATDDRLKERMGSTRKYHRWQIAYKKNTEKAEVVVKEVIPQTSRTGRLTPVAILEPTRLSGATISRATAHHYGMVKSKGIGPGALIKLVRSGLVIPKIEAVIDKVDAQLPDFCPSCQSTVVWDGDNLFCPNTTNCPAQAENTIIHFFKTLRIVDGFGPKVIRKLYDSGVRTIHEVYSLRVDGLVEMGFGQKTSENLVSQLMNSRNVQIEDSRYLAAFGVPRLGEGNCEKLLRRYRILEIFDLSVQDIAAIEGFAESTAQTVHEGLQNIKVEFDKLYDMGFQLSESSTTVTELLLKDELIVFTGTMAKGSRSEMESEAKALGAKIGKTVTGKTTCLVVGQNVGETKLAAARDKSVKIMSEDEYLQMITFGGT